MTVRDIAIAVAKRIGKEEGLIFTDDIAELFAMRLLDELAALGLAGRSALDSQVGGEHYKRMGIYQPWLVAKHTMTPEEMKGAMKITVESYIMREAWKGGRADIKKAYHTLGIYLELTKDQDDERCNDNA